jgi:hypothetical protein
MARLLLVQARNRNTITAITRDAMAAKGLLRRSSVNTTLVHYIKDVPEVTANGLAWAHIEQIFGKVDRKTVQ